MEFGKLPSNELASIQFLLPTDTDLTKRTLASAGKVTVPLVYVGCAKWGRKEWVGNIYPPKTKEADFLHHYVNHFNSIELNATHYQLYGSDTIAKWADKAKDKDFKFCPKIPQVISHYSNLISPQAKKVTDDFQKNILAFEDHLGPIFMQVSEKFSPAKKSNLFDYLGNLPTDIAFFVEVRHPSWFSDDVVRKELFERLEQLKIGAIITDTAGRRDCVHMELPIPKAFIRFVGNNLHTSDYTRIDEWVLRIKQWLDNGLQEIYFFMHHPEEKFSPELSAYVVEQLNKHCGLNLQGPVFVAMGDGQ